MDATTIGEAPELPATAQRIRASALRLYARQGPTGTGVRQIAADAHAAPGLIRHHFGSKAGLTRAVDDLVLSVIAETLRTAADGAATGSAAVHVDAAVPDDAGTAAAALSAARDAAFARMLAERPEIAGYLRWCLIAPAPDPAEHDRASADDGLTERLVDLALGEARRLRRAGAGTSRDLRSSVLSTLLRQVGSMVVQPLTDRLWQRLEPAADAEVPDAPAPRVRIAMPSEGPAEQD